LTESQSIDFTRDDADRITRMETLLIDMNQKIDKINTNFGGCQSNCSGSRGKYDKRLKIVEDFVKGNKIVQSWKDAIFSKTTVVVGCLIAIVDFSFRVFPR
jgi:hypothetical protein